MGHNPSTIQTPYQRSVITDLFGTPIANQGVSSDPVLSSASFHNGRRTGASANGDYYDCWVNLDAGVYSPLVFYTSTTNGPIYSLYLDGELVGSFDGYAASGIATVGKLTNVFVWSSGLHRLRVKANGHNASSGGYQLQAVKVDWGDPTSLPSAAAPNLFYVNAGTGSDSNSGRLSSTPFATLNAALARVAGGALTSYATKVAPGSTLREQIAYTGSALWTVQSLTPGTKFPLYASVQHTSGWTSAGGGVYAKVIGAGYSSSLYTVVVTDVLDIDGQFTKLERDVTTPTTPVAGRFGWDSGTQTLYVNLPDGSNPNSHVIEVGNSPGKAMSVVGSGKLEVHDAWLRFANLAGLQAGDGLSALGLADIYDSQVDYAGGSAGVYSSIDGSIVNAYRTGVYNTTKNDGYSAHGASTLDVEDGESAYNGGPIVTGTPQGATAHETSTFRWRTSGTSTDPNAGRIHHDYGGGYIGAQTPNVTIAGADAAHPVVIDHNFWRQDINSLLPYQAAVSFQTVGMTGSVTYVSVSNNPNCRGIYRAAGVNVPIDAYTLAHSGVANGNGAADTIL